MFSSDSHLLLMFDAFVIGAFVKRLRHEYSGNSPRIFFNSLLALHTMMLRSKYVIAVCGGDLHNLLVTAFVSHVTPFEQEAACVDSCLLTVVCDSLRVFKLLIKSFCCTSSSMIHTDSSILSGLLCSHGALANLA